MRSVISAESRPPRKPSRGTLRPLGLLIALVVWTPFSRAANPGPGPTVLFDNGPVSNRVGTGVDGADESLLLSRTLGMSTFGFGHQESLDRRITDEFEILEPAGWHIDSIVTFAYVVGSGTESQITGANVRILSGPPWRNSDVVFGDTVTNRLASTDWTQVYRVPEPGSGVNSLRPIMFVEISIDADLAPGRYWLDWQVDAPGSGAWAPPIAVQGSPPFPQPGVTGNARQRLDGEYIFVTDGFTRTRQGFPFLILGQPLRP